MKVSGFGFQVSGFLAALVFAGIPTVSAQPGTLNPEPETSPAPFLWKIESPGAATSYIFGTIHLPRPSVTNLPDVVADALRNADAVYTEIPMDPATVLGMMPRMMLPDGGTLTELLPPDLYADLGTTVATIQPSLDLTPFERMKIWAVAAGLVSMEDQLKYPGAVALDLLLFQRAAMSGKETGGLETVDEQLSLFDDLYREQQIALLRETIRQLREFAAEGKSPTDLLVDTYLAGDLDGLESEMNRWMSAGDPELNAWILDRLLIRRNLLMAERMAEKIRAHPTTGYFFAVGAAHLYGAQGVIALLEKDGFTLTRLKP